MEHRLEVDAPTLTKHWVTSLETATATATLSTTHCGIHYYARPFNNPFRTSQAQLSHRLLQVPFYSDTLFF